MLQPLKIAATQSRIHRDISVNGVHIRELIVKAHGQGARLVHFTEGALSGYVKSQILDWKDVSWDVLTEELTAIAALCAELKIWAVIGSAHRLGPSERPHNSLYVISDAGLLVTRYDKRFLSHSEISDWYTPGFDPIVFEIDGYRIGCAICIENVFPEVFAEYERQAVDCVLLSTFDLNQRGEILACAHASTNCYWFSVSVPSEQAGKGAAGLIGPNGDWVCRATQEPLADLVIGPLDTSNPDFEIPLKKARFWRSAARAREIYEARRSHHPRSLARTEF